MDEKLTKLIISLSNKTKQKEAKWERTGKSEKFNLILENGIVSMDKIITNKGNLVFQFSISNLNGDVIQQLNGIKKDSNEFNPNYETLKEFHQNIKMAYFKVDETIEGLLDEIEKKGEIGKENDDLPF